MRLFLTCLFVALTTLLAGCFNDSPSEEQVKSALVSYINKKKSPDSTGVPDIVSFKKVDGKVSEVNKTYLYFFEADVTFNNNMGFSCFLGRCEARVKTHQKLHMSGAVLFEKRDSGWVSIDNNIELKTLSQ